MHSTFSKFVLKIRCHFVSQSVCLPLIIYSVGLLVIIAKSDDVAVSNRLSRQLCNNYDDSKLGKVLSDYSQSLPICPVFEKEESTNEWVFNNCGHNNDGGDQRSESGADGSGNKRSGKVRGLNKPKGGSEGDVEDYDERIINGRDAPPFSHPYLVYIRTEAQPKGLSGTLYNRYTIIVNTYHLMANLASAGAMDNLRIHIGKHVNKSRENEEQLRFMCNYTHHPKYQKGSKGSYYVYSAIHLYDPITVNNYADKIRFAKPNQASSLSQNCVLPGWGEMKKSSSKTSPILQEANATLRDCKYKVDDNEFCTNPVYCWADSGSPLVCTDKHRVFASGLASASEDKKTCSSTNTIYADLKIQDVHDWAEKSFKDHQEMCRPWVRAEVVNSANNVF